MVFRAAHDALVLLAGAVEQVFVVHLVCVLVLKEEADCGTIRLCDSLSQAALHIPVHAN